MSTEQTQPLVQTLQRLAELSHKAGLHTIEKEILDERIPSLQNQTMTVVVLGEFNHGKSSTINALLERDVLPTGITPTTSVITHVSRGTGPSRVVRESGTTEVTADQLRDLIVNDAPEDLVRVEVFTDSSFLDEGVLLVDTPGVNDISQQKVEITYGYVPRADVVLYVLDATQALKRSEISFIEHRLIRNNHERVFFILGKSDVLSPDELEEVKRHVKTKLADIFGPATIYPISARLAAQKRDPGFDEFRGALRRYIETQREQIVLDGARKAFRRLGSMMGESLAIRSGALALQEDELQRRVEAVRERLTRSRTTISSNIALIDQRALEIAAAARDSVRTFTEEFAAALPGQVERASADDVKRYMPDFIHDTFKDWIETEGGHVAMRLEMLAEEIISITNQNMRETMNDANEQLGLATRDLDLDVDTFGYDVGVFALGALGVTFLAFNLMVVGGLLTVAAPVLAFVMKDKVEDAVRTRAQEQGVLAVRRAGQKVEAEFDLVIADFARKLSQFVEDAGDRLYRQVMEVLENVVDERARHAQDNEASAKAVAELRSELVALIEEFGQRAPAKAPEV